MARARGLLGDHAPARLEAEAALAGAAANPNASQAMQAEADLVLAEAAIATARTGAARIPARARPRTPDRHGAEIACSRRTSIASPRQPGTPMTGETPTRRAWLGRFAALF